MSTKDKGNETSLLAWKFQDLVCDLIPNDVLTLLKEFSVRIRTCMLPMEDIM